MFTEVSQPTYKAETGTAPEGRDDTRLGNDRLAGSV